MARPSLMSVYRRFDIFGQGVSFNVDGKEKVNSCMGATMSLLVAVVTITYAWTRFGVLLEFGDTKFQDSEDYRGSAIETEVFSQADTNFNIAFGLQPVPGSGFTIDDFTGYLDFVVVLFKDFESGGPKPLGLHQCN